MVCMVRALLLLLLGDKAGWESCSSQLGSPIASKSPESDNATPRLKVVGPYSDHPHIVKVVRFEATDNNSRLLVCGNIPNCCKGWLALSRHHCLY
jgi:hypothetical protein